MCGKLVLGIGAKLTCESRLVELGRVVLLNDGPCAGKLATVVEIIDHKRARLLLPLAAHLRNLTGVP